MTITRRSFLKLSAGTLLSLAWRGFHLPQEEIRSDNSKRLGRTIYSLRYYDQPSLKGKELGYYNRDSVVEIFEAMVGDPEPKNNPIWYRTERGWIHSSYVQPVQDIENEPVWDFPSKGFLAEVSVPFAQAWIVDRQEFKRSYRYYYASTHWVNFISKDDYGNIWYQVVDDRKGGFYYVLAKYLRQVASQELTSLSPTILDKTVQINLAEQRLSAYENGRVVMTCRVSTGTFEGDTPTGDFQVERKQPSRHMAANESRGNGFDLPGVPWVSYISWTGISMHGTYWHNDFGQPRSHGCINLSPEAARWIYRWTLPNLPVEDDYIESDYGTRVTVV
jgi:lipoprotein-anchoring transpeptidase ErfK/SrfK